METGLECGKCQPVLKAAVLLLGCRNRYLRASEAYAWHIL